MTDGMDRWQKRELNTGTKNVTCQNSDFLNSLELIETIASTSCVTPVRVVHMD
jgi:hypothetical protein